ncbi:hypothetical protein GPM59_001120 [Salmonella enterica]|nr:hypothetical protein [Salmonella enterica]EDZ0485046.1 hypothetical protein [Salmonella enterica]
MMTWCIITLSLIKAPSSGGAFPFQPLADIAIVGEWPVWRKGFLPPILRYWIAHAKWPAGHNALYRQGGKKIKKSPALWPGTGDMAGVIALLPLLRD